MRWENSMLRDYVVIDLEMTGLKVKQDRILETGAVRVRNGRAAETYGALLCPGIPLPEEITALTNITDEMAAGGRDPEEAMAEFFAFLGDDILVGHNVIYDYWFLKQWAVNHQFSFERSAVDTLKLAREFFPKEQKKDLASLCKYYGIARRNAHRAADDAWETFLVFRKLQEQFGEREEAFVPGPLRCAVRRQTPATEHQKENMRRYAAHFGLALPEGFDRLTRSEASRLTDQWILRYGRLPAAHKRRQSRTDTASDGADTGYGNP